VQVISVVDRQRATRLNAISYLEKPVTRDAVEGAFSHVRAFIDREVRELLLVEDDEVQRTSIMELIGAPDVNVTAVATGEEALKALESRDFDCMVLDLSLPDMAGFDVLRTAKKQERHRSMPVIIYTSKDLTRSEETQLKRYAASVITKGGTVSSDQLLDETAMFLHQIVAKMPETKRQIVEKRTKVVPSPARGNSKRKGANGRSKAAIQAAAASRKPLAGRRVLIVDDDVRNIFALASALESEGLVVYFEESAQAGIAKLEANPEIDAVLMDVMMPEMDGYEAIQAIRRNPLTSGTPIIALTAKALAGDREKCIQAGATDYIPKPVVMDRLIDILNKHVAAEVAHA
jgi:CheY-like chemotaxis protein